MYAGRDRRAARRSTRCSRSRSIPTPIGLLGSIPRLDRAARAAGRRSRARCRHRLTRSAGLPLRRRAAPSPIARCRERGAAAGRPRSAPGACWRACCRRRSPLRTAGQLPVAASMTRRCSRSRAWSSISRCARGCSAAPTRAVRAVDGVSFDARRRRDAGAGRRIGLRQVDRRPAAAAPDRADRGPRPLRRRATCCALDAQATARAPRATCRSSSRIPTPRSTRA